MIRATRTYAVLDVTPACYAEVRAALDAAGYQHAFHVDDGREVIDLHGLALRAEPEIQVGTETIPRTLSEW